jgi:peptidoglycan biosynthesis protein MviN/MurJ (putative lipid II flippase)
MSYATAAFPSLSLFVIRQEMDKFSEQVFSTAQHIIFWSLPILALMIILRAQIVRTVLGSGLFDLTATKLTAATFALFAISVPAQSLALLFIRAFYAAGRNKIPFFVSMFSAFLIIVGGYGFLHFYDQLHFLSNSLESLLHVEGVVGTRVLILPLVYSLGMLIHTGLLIYLFYQCFQYPAVSIRKTLMQGLLATLIGGFVTYQFLEVLSYSLNLNSLRGIFLQGLGAGIAGSITWYIILELLKNEEIQQIRNAFFSKFWKGGVIIPDKEEI